MSTLNLVSTNSFQIILSYTTRKIKKKIQNVVINLVSQSYHSMSEVRYIISLNAQLFSF